ncbi:MAG: acylphosphatase [Tepidisphaeraceae bacterium]
MATTSDSARCHCFFKGRVQGVGFRYTTRNLAISYDVTGFVRNLPDGRVELVAEGPEQQVNSFVTAINERMRPHIKEVEQVEEPASGDYGQFVIGR